MHFKCTLTLTSALSHSCIDGMPHGESPVLRPILYTILALASTHFGLLSHVEPPAVHPRHQHSQFTKTPHRTRISFISCLFRIISCRDCGSLPALLTSRHATTRFASSPSVHPLYRGVERTRQSKYHILTSLVPSGLFFFLFFSMLLVEQSLFPLPPSSIHQSNSLQS